MFFGGFRADRRPDKGRISNGSRHFRHFKAEIRLFPPGFEHKEIGQRAPEYRRIAEQENEIWY